MRRLAPIALLLGVPWAFACHSSAAPLRDVTASTRSAPTPTSSAFTVPGASAMGTAEPGATMQLVARVRNRHAGLRRTGPGAIELFAHDADGTSVTVKNVKVDLGKGPQETCALVPSSDGHVYAACNNGAVPLIVRTPDAWVRVARASTLKLGTEPRLCVARDLAIWAWEGGGDLTRVLPDGRREQVALPRAPAELLRPSYEGSYPEMMSATWARGADGGVRFWQSTRVVRAEPPREVVAIENVVPLDDGSVWALGWEGGHTQVMVLMRAGRGASASASEARVALREIGSPFDQQNEVRNAKEPRPWTSRCPQVFVAFDVASHEIEAKEALLARKHRLGAGV